MHIVINIFVFSLSLRRSRKKTNYRTDLTKISWASFSFFLGGHVLLLLKEIVLVHFVAQFNMNVHVFAREKLFEPLHEEVGFPAGVLVRIPGTAPREHEVLEALKVFEPVDKIRHVRRVLLHTQGNGELGQKLQG